jgi:hypothetical protein
MNDLRHDINEVFAKQQAQLGDAAGTGNRMLRAATSGRRVNRQLWPSLAGVALVLVAAFAIGASIVIRGLHPRNVVTNHPSPSAIATPTATPAPTPMSQALQVPATTPVILFQDSVDRQQIDGVTWDGSASGRVGMAEPGMGFVQNPAGTLYGWTGSVRDRGGAVVGTVPASPNFKSFPGIWADDGRHICSMFSESPFGQAGGKPTTLQVTTVGKQTRNVVQVGRANEQGFIEVMACSIEKDRAVIVQSGSMHNAVQLWVVQLSSGRILWSRSYAADGTTIVNIQASRDGQFIAENQNSCCPTATKATTIYGPTGAVLAHPAGTVDGFSWDGSLALLGTYDGPVLVVNWKEGTVVWNGPSNAGYWSAMPEPGGRRIAVWVHATTVATGSPLLDVYAIAPDGQAVKLLTNVQ